MQNHRLNESVENNENRDDAHSSDTQINAAPENNGKFGKANNAPNSVKRENNNSNFYDSRRQSNAGNQSGENKQNLSGAEQNAHKRRDESKEYRNNQHAHEKKYNSDNVAQHKNNTRNYNGDLPARHQRQSRNYGGERQQSRENNSKYNSRIRGSNAKNNSIQKEPKYDNLRNYRKTGTAPHPITIMKALHRLDFASPKITLQAMQSGFISVNGSPATQQDMLVCRQKDIITAYGRELRARQDSIYVVMNKLRNVSGSYERSGLSIYKNFYRNRRWFFPVGCLDKTVGGVVILTTDFKHKSPEKSSLYYLDKEYHCKLHRLMSPEEIVKLQKYLNETLSEDIEVFTLRRNSRNIALSITTVKATPASFALGVKKIWLGSFII